MGGKVDGGSVKTFAGGEISPVVARGLLSVEIVKDAPVVRERNFLPGRIVVVRGREARVGRKGETPAVVEQNPVVGYCVCIKCQSAEKERGYK